jgi:antitoxin VapB
MSLFIKGDEIDRLAAAVQQAIGARSKSEAVKLALEHELARTNARIPLSKRLTHAKALAARIGEPNAAFDMKAFTDKMWSD